MGKYNLIHFGEIDTDDLEEYYETDIELKGNPVQIDLNFENSSVEPGRMDLIKRFIEQIPAFDSKNKIAIKEDYENEDCDTARTYIEHHLEEINQEQLAHLVEFGNKETDAQLQLLSALRLVRVGLYPDNEAQFATFDYSIDPEITQYLVVIFTDINGELDYMTMES